MGFFKRLFSDQELPFSLRVDSDQDAWEKFVEREAQTQAAKSPSSPPPTPASPVIKDPAIELIWQMIRH